MSKQLKEEWKRAIENTKAFNFNVYAGVGKLTGSVSFEDALDEVTNLVYSLHLEEIEKIREKIKRMKDVNHANMMNGQFDSNYGYNKAMGDVLLTIAE